MCKVEIKNPNKIQSLLKKKCVAQFGYLERDSCYSEYLKLDLAVCN